MDVPKILSELYSELEQIEQEIQTLERKDTRTAAAAAGSMSETKPEPDAGLQ
jgi:hypothetical protein